MSPWKRWAQRVKFMQALEEQRKIDHQGTVILQTSDNPAIVACKHSFVRKGGSSPEALLPRRYKWTYQCVFCKEFVVL